MLEVVDEMIAAATTARKAKVKVLVKALAWKYGSTAKAIAISFLDLVVFCFVLFFFTSLLSIC